MLPLNRNEYFSPRKSFLLTLKAGVAEDRIGMLRARLIGDGAEAIEHGYSADDAAAVIRGRAPIASLNRYARNHKQGLWFNDVVVQLVFGDVPIPAPTTGKKGFDPQFDLRLRLSLRTMRMDSHLEGVTNDIAARAINLEQLFIDRRSGVLYATMDLAGSADEILDIERRVGGRRYFPELHPAAEISTLPLSRPDLEPAETIRFYGQGSRPGIYDGLREEIAAHFNAECIWAEEIRDALPEEDRPWRGQALLTFKPGRDRDEAVDDLRHALTAWGLTSSLTAHRAIWSEIIGPTPPGTPLKSD